MKTRNWCRELYSRRWASNDGEALCGDHRAHQYGYLTFSPDVPGCAAVGDTEEDTRRNCYEALVAHFEAMREVGESIPEPQSSVDYVEIAAQPERTTQNELKRDAFIIACGIYAKLKGSAPLTDKPRLVPYPGKCLTT
jgi:predicted RNase H-like HicB family nuclease